jgi:2,3-bisphosphoglycerate-independent phosphoglycerate mutase
MIPQEIIRSLAHRSPTKIVQIVIDGLGGLTYEGRTELEAADCPCLDRLAADSACGLMHPVGRGITPGSGPAHLALFGYDPLRHEIGRGVLEALGVGLSMTDRDVAARGNFATRDPEGAITDRRAGRIPTEKNEQLCALLSEKIPQVEDVEIILKPGKEHRMTVLFRGDGLDGRLADADPQVAPAAALQAEPLRPEAEHTAHIVNEYIRLATQVLQEESPANTILLRGFAKYPEIPSMTELFKLQPAAIAGYPMYRGLAQLVGMKVLDTGDAIADEINTLRREFVHHDFFYVHIKKTDSYGEDGNFEKKVAVIEELDHHLPTVLSLEPDVICITADHSTPSLLKAHSWHPCPILLWSEYCLADSVSRFTELECTKGSLGRFPAMDAMTLMLANALKLNKYGA